MNKKRWKHAFFKGTLQWSVPVTLFYTIFMSVTTDTPIIILFPVALVLFGLSGFLMQFFLWTPSANDLSEAELKKEDTDESPAEVGQGFTVIGMWFGLIIFGAMFLIGLSIQTYVPAFFFAVLTLVHLLGLSLMPKIKISNEGVEVRNWWECYFVKWEDIKKYQVDKLGSTYVLYTDDGHLPLPALRSWSASGSEKRRARSLFSRKLSELNAPCEKTEKVHYIFLPKNVRVR